MRPVIRYWGRKAGNIAAPYINKYSRPKEIVLDPFGGSGSIAKVAILLGRRCIYSDLNPLAALIARVELEGVDAQALAAASDELLKGRWTRYCSLFEVTCKCGAKRPALYFVWVGDVIKAAKVICNCGNRLIRYNGKDIEAIEPAAKLPSGSLRYPNGLPFMKRRQVNTISELFTKRNLTILAALLSDIKDLRIDERTRTGLLVAFASILYQASKMSRQNGGTWGVNCYWIPRVHVERNPYFLFTRVLKRLSHIKGLATAFTSAEPVISGDASLAILNCDAKELPLPDNSVHMIITDPPFTDEVQYFELSYLAAAWLGLEMPFDKEIIVNPKQGKKFDDYCNLLSKAFKEMYRVLKPGRTAVIMLHDEKDEILNQLIELVKGAGFIIERRKKELMVQRQIGNRDGQKGIYLLVLCCRKP
jgi:16S rRNA G966 N2-methylase RsmD